MIRKSTDVKRLQEVYEQAGNQLVIMYGRKDCEKELLIKEFVEGKKFFYYRCRQVSAEEQVHMMGEEIAKRFDVRIQNNTYDEFFNRVKSGDPSKLVIIIDEAQFLMKKNEKFLQSIIDLKNHKLYPGPVMIILSSSSTVWAEQDLESCFGTEYKSIDSIIKIEDLNFLEVVRSFPEYSVAEIIQIYGVLGGVAGYLNRWDTGKSFKQNICDLILNPKGYLFDEAQNVISSELRELSVYNTIMHFIAQGHNKLNDLFHLTGYSRAKISVYMKNLSHFDIIEKVVSFETGGWDNAKKGVYQIKDTYINFWYKFVFPHQSDLFLMEPEEFYDIYIANELDEYLTRYFRNVCMEYLSLLNQIRRLPFHISKMGTWVGKTGNIDIIAQSNDRKNIVGLCNWDKPMLTMQMCQNLFDAMEKARITSEHIYLFSAKAFEPSLVQKAKEDARFELIDMNEL